MSIFDDFDFVCISIDYRQDRRDKIKLVFRDLEILDRINWWIVEKHPAGGIYGCFESHYCVWNCGEFEKKYLCVFEDDVYGASEDFKESFLHTLTFAQKHTPKVFDILSLQARHGHSKLKISDSPINVYLGFYMALGCYIINKDSVPKISQKIRSWYGMGIDTALYKNCRMAAVIPPIFDQNPKDSDNVASIGSYIPKILENPTRIFIEKVPFVGFLFFELSQLISIYRIYDKAQPELKDRRIKSIQKDTMSAI